MSRALSHSSYGGKPQPIYSVLLRQPQLSKSWQTVATIPSVFAPPRPACGKVAMAALIRRRPSRSIGYVLAERSTDGSSLTDSLRRTLPVRKVLEELFEATGYTVCLGTIHFRSVVYLHRLYRSGYAQRYINQELHFGPRAPLYCTALGKALLTGLTESWRYRLLLEIDFIPRGPRSHVTAADLLAELAKLDYREPIVSNEEYLFGARSIAVCVRREHGKQPIAIEVTVPADAFTMAELIELVGPSVKYAADRIAQIEARGYIGTSRVETRGSDACYDTRRSNIYAPMTDQDDIDSESDMPAGTYTDSVNPYKAWYMRRAFRLGWDAAEQGVNDKQARQQVAAAKLNRMATIAWWRGFDTQREDAPDAAQAS